MGETRFQADRFSHIFQSTSTPTETEFAALRPTQPTMHKAHIGFSDLLTTARTSSRWGLGGLVAGKWVKPVFRQTASHTFFNQLRLQLRPNLQRCGQRSLQCTRHTLGSVTS